MSNSLDLEQDYPVIEKSNEWYERALKRIPATTQTLAKGPQMHVNGVAPKFIDHARGSHVWDVDGNQYVDMTMGVGPLILGYCWEPVDRAIREQLSKGITYTLVHPLEVEVAELVSEVIPNADMVRYSKTGADVCSAAIRVSRAFTGREKVLCCGYHGWHDWYISVTTRNQGIPKSTVELTHTFDYNDIQSVIESIDEDTAAVILEPATFDEPEDNFLQDLKEVCQKFGALLIFDEMWTGFRFAVGGAQEYFGVEPDLAVYSKAIANGMPLSVIAGRKDVMSYLDEGVFFYTTFGGEALSLAAARATINELRKNDVHETIFARGKRLKDGYNGLVARMGLGELTECVGFDCRTMVKFKSVNDQDPLIIKSLAQQEMIKRGVLWGGFHNMAFAHSDKDVEHVLAAYEQVLPIVTEAVERGNVREELRGEPIQSVFRKQSDFNTRPKANS